MLVGLHLFFMKLRTRFSILTGLLVIIIIIVFNIFIYLYEKEILTQEIKSREQAIAENFFTVCQDAAIRNDDILILNYIKGIKRTHPGVRYAYLMEPSGLVLTLYDSRLFTIPERDVFQNISPDVAPRTILWTGADGTEVIEISKVLIMRNKIMGLSVIGFSNTYYERIFLDNIKNLQNRIFGISVIMLALGLAGSFFLSSTMVRPIHNMSKAVKQIGAGNLDQEIDTRDTSELGELAREFNRMALNLQELDDLKRHFIASVSHELRSPLNAIEGHIDFLIEELYTGYDRDRVMDILNTVKKNSTRLSSFINNILDLSKMESGKLDLDIESLHLANFGEEAVELFAPLAREKNITLENKISFKKSLKVDVDRARLRQVFNNLIANAIKYTPEGGKISLEAYSTGTLLVEVSVKDTGIGISSEKINRIFDKFMQIRSHREDVGNVKGTGLGLTIVKGIVEAHGGTIRVESFPEKGSTFIFTLPASKKSSKLSDDS